MHIRKLSKREASSSNGRAADSKSAGWGFESLLACQKGGLMKIGQFLKEVRAEMARVEWPKPEEFIGATIVTLLLVIFFTIYLGLVDKANKWIIYDKIFTQIRK
jgi:preprotein translocase SecE subunit